MIPAYARLDSYQRKQMPFYHCHHPGIEAIPPQIKNTSKSLYGYEQLWLYTSSYENLTPLHFFYGHNNFPGYYSYKPAPLHAPAPSPIYYCGGCPEYIEPLFVPRSPSPCYFTVLPRYERDIRAPREYCCIRCPNHACHQEEGESMKVEKQGPNVDKAQSDLKLQNPSNISEKVIPNGVYKKTSTGNQGSWTNGDRYKIKENKVDTKAENIIKEEVSEPREARHLIKPTDGECRKERKVLLDEAAVLIQAAYRGFQERKGEPLKKLKHMAEISKEVTDVSGRIHALEASYDLQNDDKQMIIIEETIMKLLLKLDAIQGLRPSFREIRKSLARELTSLQERLDSIMAKKSQQQMQDLSAREAVQDTHLNHQNREYVQEQEEKVAASRGSSSGGTTCGTDPFVLTSEIVNKNVSQMVFDDANISESGPSETENEVVENEKKLEVECQSAEVGNDTKMSSLTTKRNGDEVGQEDACLQVTNIHPGAVESKMNMGTLAPSSNDLEEEDEPLERSLVFVASPASKELLVSEHDGGLHGYEKLEEDNKKLMEMMHKLLKAGNEQSTLISDLTSRVKDLEKKLARRK